MILENDKRTTSNALRPFEKVRISKVCPVCSSVFVTKKECESCGYQFWIDLLGEPFGDRSFFVLSDDFELDKPWFFKLLSDERVSRHKLTRKYRRALLKRFEVLVGYFFDEQEQDRAKRKSFLFEAHKLMDEFIKYGGAPSALWKFIERGEKHPLAASLFQQLYIIESREKPKTSLISNALVMNSFKEGLFGEFLLSVAAVTTAAFLVLKYLIS